MTELRAVTESELQAYVDGRLPEPRRAEVEGWLAARPEEAERIAAYRQLNEELHATYDGLLAEPVPPGLGLPPRAVRWRTMALAASWMLAGLALGGLAGWQLRALQAPSALALDSNSIARRAAIAHATYSPEVRHPVEVGADQEQHLIAWLSKRLGVKVQIPSLDAAGMSLVGGRLLPGESGPVALFMYQTQAGRRLTLYVRAEASRNRETAFRYARENNVGVFYWIDGDRGYALASADLDKDELLRIATLVYKQLEP
ncbi:MAG TPA: anti-sigma factor [Burkholderiales bacterium]|nr:anti-sigma factor [Burkholderiales bacterium]